MPIKKFAAYETAAPYFDLVRGALGELVEGEHFFDVVADDVVFEVLYELGWPRVTHGRAALMSQFRGYCESMQLQSADKLVIHKTDNNHVIFEYEVHGTVLATGAEYNNRFCSIIKIGHKKITHWRDYMDSLAAWKALTTNTR
jgi:ketosteroid isomerase-like protein